MKLHTERQEVMSNFVGEEIDFRIDQNSHVIFSILRDKLYQDPLSAVCREIPDNARDAHREVGTPERPVEIVLPGDYLVIRDFGPGISPDRIKEIYCAYGASTKRTDNSQGGGYGIGAKCPFALSDSFAITTIYDGIKYEYNAYIDESHRGKIRLMAQNETNEPTMTEIRIPIRAEDRHTCIERVKYYTQYWHLFGDAAPKLIGQYGQQTPIEIVVKGNSWAVLGGYVKAPVFVNGIPYELENYHVDASVPRCVALMFGPGVLDLASNRETLQYTDRTKKAIKQAIETCKKELAENTNDKVKQAKDLNEAISVINAFLETLSYEFRGHEYEWDYNGTKFTYPKQNHFYTLAKSRYRRNKTELSLTDRLYDADAEHLVILTKDNIDGALIKQTARKKIVEWMNQEGLDKVYLVHPDFVELDGTKVDDIKILRGPRQGGSGRPKGQVKGYEPNSSHGVYYDVDRTGKDEIYYTQRNDGYMWKYRDIARLYNVTLVGLEPANCKRVSGETGWTEAKELVNKLEQEFTKDEIKAYINSESVNIKNTNYSFIANRSDIDVAKIGLTTKNEVAITDDKMPFVRALITHYGLSEKENNAVATLTKYCPMLKFVSGYAVYDSVSKNLISNYIQECLENV